MALHSVLSLIAATIGALLIGALLFRRANRKANLVLCVILATTLYCQWVQVLWFTGQIRDYPHLRGTGYICSFLIPSLVYLYVLALTIPGFHWRRIYWLHFLPVAFAILTYGVFQYFDLWNNPTVGPWANYIWRLIDVVVSGSYFYAALLRLRKYRRKVQELFSELRWVRLQWLLVIIVLCLIPWTVQLFDAITGPRVRVEGALVVAITLGFLFMGFFGLRQSVIFRDEETWQPENAALVEEELNARPTFFNESQLAELKAKLEKQVVEKQLFLDPELRLGDLALGMGLKSYQVSEILNRGFQSNFYDYINRFRVEEAKRRLCDPAYAHMNILGIAVDSGFNSKSVFNKMFRTVTGLTPSAYRTAAAPTLPQA